jgi:hypothetical protein
LAWLAMMTVACAQTATPARKDPMKRIDLWTLIDYLPTRMPLDREKLQSALGVVLNLTDSNDYTDFFEGGPVHLLEDVDVEKLELRVNKQNPLQRLLILSLSGRCVERPALLSRYKDLQLTGHPRGRSPDEETSWSKQHAWGKLSFGFPERNPNCLRTVVFNAPATP